jgi:hypothetical protein
LLAAETDFEVEMATEPTAKPWIVAIQPGHFELKRLPDELAHIRGDTETSYGPVREADINKFVADALIQRIVAQTDRPDNYTSYRSFVGVVSKTRPISVVSFVDPPIDGDDLNYDDVVCYR